VIVVDERDIPPMIRHLALRNKIVAEAAGALAVAAARAQEPERGGKAVAIVSGGSIDPDRLAEIITAG
jgi:threonine dehydratase